MAIDNVMKRKVVRKIDSLDQAELEKLYNWLGLDLEDDMQTAKQRNLALSGVWKGIPDLVFTSVLREIYTKRKTKKL